MRRPAVLLALIATVLCGCGYGLRGTLPGHLRTIAIPTFTNRTSEPGVENFLTRAVVEAFSSNGRLRVVEPAAADSILDGEVTGYELQSIAFDPSANVRQYRLIVTMNLRYRDIRDEKLLFDRRGYQERADFRVAGAVSDTIAREQGALRQASVDIARSIVAFTLERF
jgi:outer membrane lipopolysaccharide assembly protein LptE/RlpB